MAASQTQITQLLMAWTDGDRTALNQIIPLVHAELRRLAHYHMRRERNHHTLQTTALLNEAYIRLLDYKSMRWQDRFQFLAVAAQAMRRILVDHARARDAGKRGAGANRLDLEEVQVAVELDLDMVALDQALKSLARIDPQQARIVELRFFGGLSWEETAETIGKSASTVKRDWSMARAWLHRELKR